MTRQKASLLIPVENQIRELDAKLRLATVAAKRGLASIIGPKRLVESRAASYPRSDRSGPGTPSAGVGPAGELV